MVHDQNLVYSVQKATQIWRRLKTAALPKLTYLL